MRRKLRSIGEHGHPPAVRGIDEVMIGLNDLRLQLGIANHFELLAWSETKIMLRFWIIAAVCSGIGFTTASCRA